jgi:hypothetical protein
MKPNILFKDGQFVLAKDQWFRLKELKTLEDVLKAINALQLSFETDVIEKYNLFSIVENEVINKQNK